MSPAEAEVRALAHERDELEIENRALRAQLRLTVRRLVEAQEEIARLRTGERPGVAEAAL